MTTAKKVKVQNNSVGVRELRQAASQILDQVKAGVTVEITEHGVPVARIVPITRSLFEEYLENGRIIPARNPNRIFTMPKGKVSKGKQLSEILIEERRTAKF
jgi:prevent-host-death family protein